MIKAFIRLRTASPSLATKENEEKAREERSLRLGLEEKGDLLSLLEAIKGIKPEPAAWIFPETGQISLKTL